MICVIFFLISIINNIISKFTINNPCSSSLRLRPGMFSTQQQQRQLSMFTIHSSPLGKSRSITVQSPLDVWALKEAELSIFSKDITTVLLHLTCLFIYSGCRLSVAFKILFRWLAILSLHIRELASLVLIFYCDELVMLCFSFHRNQPMQVVQAAMPGYPGEILSVVKRWAFRKSCLWLLWSF